MAKPSWIELPTGEKAEILYENRAVIAIDKPRDWLLAPLSWERTSRNLQAALMEGIRDGEFWARSRGLKFLRFVHRLDAETTGVLLLGKSPGAVSAYGRLFESRQMAKVYLAVVEGMPKDGEWSCDLPLGPDDSSPGRMRVDRRTGKQAETHFKILSQGEQSCLIEARPWTGRTHQIRVHLAAAGHRVVGDELYGAKRADRSLALRAIELACQDPFTGKPFRIKAPTGKFLAEYGFANVKYE